MHVPPYGLAIHMDANPAHQVGHIRAAFESSIWQPHPRMDRDCPCRGNSSGHFVDPAKSLQAGCNWVDAAEKFLKKATEASVVELRMGSASQDI
jgi:hypothetical protein